MSHASNTWARRLPAAAFERDSPDGQAFDRSKLKFLMNELADCEQGNSGEVWPSIALLAEKTLMDRKTVQLYLRELVRRGLIEDTGRREGRTKQVPVFRLVGFDADEAFARRQFEQRKNPNNPADGTVSKNAVGATESRPQVAESYDENHRDSGAIDGLGETTPPTGLLLYGTNPAAGSIPPTGPVPPVMANDPTGDGKRPHRRGTERVLNGSIEPSEAHAPARRGARERGAVPTDAERITGVQRYWAREVVSQFVDAIRATLPEHCRHDLHQLPRRLADLVRDRAAPIIADFAGRELRDGVHPRTLQEAMQAAARPVADEVVRLYRNGFEVSQCG